MRLASELSLPFMAVDTTEFADDPFERFKEARAEHPWLAKASFGYIITEFDAMREVLSMDDKLRPPHAEMIRMYGAEGSRWERFQLESLMAIRGAPHKRVRDVVAAAFTPRAANMHRGLMQATIKRVLDEWAPRGGFDFEEFASYFPINVMCNLLGADPKAIPGLREALQTLGLSFNMIPGFLPRLNEACETLEAYLDAFIVERRAGIRRNAEPDLMDALIEARDSGGLSDEELNSLLIFLFVAGYDTSKNVLTLTMDLLLDRPNVYERCAKEQGFCRKVVEESLRFRSPASITRTTDVDLEYRGVLFPKDTMMMMPVIIAGRDPSTFANPDVFDPDRHVEERHMAFGRGEHICLGQYIARAQIEEGLYQIAQRLKHPKRVGPSGRRPFPGVWGLMGLPIEFTPAEAAIEETGA